MDIMNAMITVIRRKLEQYRFDKSVGDGNLAEQIAEVVKSELESTFANDEVALCAAKALYKFNWPGMDFDSEPKGGAFHKTYTEKGRVVARALMALLRP